jgi:hypothetical protein
VSRLNESEWAQVQRRLATIGVVLLAVALERLANATLLGSSVGARTALTFSLAFGLTGAAVLSIALVVRRLGGPRKPVS